MFVAEVTEDEVEVGDGDVFDRAAGRLAELATQLDPELLLNFYALFKQATVGPCNVPKPGIFDLRGRKKWYAWFELGNMCRITARQKYISKLQEVDPAWDPKAHCKSGGVRVSKMAFSGLDPAPQECDNVSVFAAVKDGRGDLLVSILLASPEHVHLTDANGMTPLHWAADRGHSHIISTLLSHSAAVNAQDKDGQTPLHYACSCGHMVCCKILVQSGADLNMVDRDGQSAIELMEAHLRSELLSACGSHPVVPA